MTRNVADLSANRWRRDDIRNRRVAQRDDWPVAGSGRTAELVGSRTNRTEWYPPPTRSPEEDTNRPLVSTTVSSETE